MGACASSPRTAAAGRENGPLALRLSPLPGPGAPGKPLAKVTGTTASSISSHDDECTEYIPASKQAPEDGAAAAAAHALHMLGQVRGQRRAQ